MLLHVSDKLPLELGVLHVCQEQWAIYIGKFDLLDRKYPVRIRVGCGLGLLL